MRSDPDNSTHRRWPWAAVLVLVVVLYLLSIGPYYLLVKRSIVTHHASGDWLIYGSEIYRPLGWLRDTSDTCDRLIQWYVGLWLE